MHSVLLGPQQDLSLALFIIPQVEHVPFPLWSGLYHPE